MTPYRKKLGSFLIFGVASVFNGVLLLATSIGLTTTPDDAENLPKFIQWLLGTPWWVPALVIPLSLIAFAFWAFGDDRSVEAAMKEYKAVNDKAWAFLPEFRAEMDKLVIDREEFAKAVAEIGRLQMTYHNSMADAADEVSRRFEERAERIVLDIFGQHFRDRREEYTIEERKRVSYQNDQIQMLSARVQALTAKIDALPQSPQGTESETPP